MPDKTKAELKDDLAATRGALSIAGAEKEELEREHEELTMRLVKQQNIVRILQARLEDSEAKRLAMRVVSGDLPAEQYEGARRASQQAITQLVTQLNQAGDK